MTVDHWEQVKDLLHQALQLGPEQRPRFLSDACSSDAVRAEVESLLSAEAGIRPTFMELPVLADEPGQDRNRFGAVGTLEAGQTFDQHFRLIRRLGEGGMGQVWLAEQTAPVRRQVAIKLIKAGMYDEAVVQRFQSERQSLAIMDHPAIAKVFDAGTTSQGQPYFVMDYVPGMPITEFCDQKRVRISDRLELFIQVCGGVQHAHQKAVIHRDLKPANILVQEIDGKPVPRIIDFGLAKATTPGEAGENLFTQLGHFMGTPGYMSPEQADNTAQDIDTRTDVYSLGVVLYVLLAGAQPFENKSGQKQPLDELLRKLREEEPPRPSSKVGEDHDISAAAAEARGTEPGQLVSALRGDLDWITMKALEKDRGRRYGAPSELAADIRRYLDHEPIVARPVSGAYRLRKYARRHRAAVVVTAGLMLLLASFSALQALQLRRITRERDRAARERDRATRITDFMTGMFTVSDPGEARGNKVTAREILDKASNDMEKGLAQDPEVRSQMTQVMASTYTNLGLFARAHELAQRALNDRLSLLGPDDPKTLESTSQLGWILHGEGKYVESEKMERQALDGERRVLGPEDPRTIKTLSELALVVQGPGDFGQGEKLAREAIAVGTRRLGAESPEVLRSMHYLGVALWNLGRYAEAEQAYRQMIEIERRVAGPDHPETVRAMDNLALAVESQGRLVEAEQLYRDTLANAQRVLGPDHPSTARIMDNLSSLLFEEGRVADAEKMCRQGLAIEERTLGPESPYALLTQSDLAGLLLEQGRVREAEKLERQTVAAMVRVIGPEHPSTLQSQATLARALNRQDRYADAEKIARPAFEAGLRTLGPQHPYTLDALQQLGTALASSHRYPEANKLFRDVIEKQGSNNPQANAFSVWYAFACVAAAANHPDDAIEYLHEAIQRGYNDANRLTADVNLKSLNQLPHFQEIVAELKRPSRKR